MLTTHRLGRVAGVGALSTLLVLAACEQSDSPTGLQPPEAALNTVMQGQVVAGSVIVCQTVEPGSTTDTGYYELDVDGTVTPFMITGTAPWPTSLGNGPVMGAGEPGCVELENVSGDAMRVRVLNATGFANSGNRVSNSTTTWTFPGAQSNPAIDPDNPGSTAWFKPILEDVPDEGIEGCTPGYWKQPQHFDSWPMTYDGMDISPETTLYSEVFGIGPDITLLEALEARGNRNGEALLRHSVAAFLNAASDVDYPLSAADVISRTKAAWESGDMNEINELKDELDANNNLGCPLN